MRLLHQLDELRHYAPLYTFYLLQEQQFHIQVLVLRTVETTQLK